MINDERMEGRAQMILMITGLGGQSLEDAMPGFHSKSAPASVGAGRSQAPAPAHVMSPVSAPASERDEPLRPASQPLNVASAARDLPPFFRYRYQDRRGA